MGDNEMSQNVAHSNDGVTKMPPSRNEREKMREEHPSQRVAELIETHRCLKGHSGLEAANALGVNWGTWVRMSHGACDFNNHLKEVAEYTCNAVEYIRGMAAMDSAQQAELKMRLEKSLRSYRKMISLGRSRRSQVRNALLHMEKEART